MNKLYAQSTDKNNADNALQRLFAYVLYDCISCIKLVWLSICSLFNSIYYYIFIFVWHMNVGHRLTLSSITEKLSDNFPFEGFSLFSLLCMCLFSFSHTNCCYVNFLLCFFFYFDTNNQVKYIYRGKNIHITATKIPTLGVPRCVLVLISKRLNARRFFYRKPISCFICVGYSIDL